MVQVKYVIYWPKHRYCNIDMIPMTYSAWGVVAILEEAKFACVDSLGVHTQQRHFTL